MRGDRVAIPFLYDIEAHVRFLVALPILIAAELVVHLRLLPIVRRFVERRIVSPEEMPKFHQAIESTLRLRNSAILEVLLLALVYALGFWVWRTQFAVGAPSWYTVTDGTQLRLTPAGYWYVFVSLPIFQFILLRWYLRLFFWFWFLFRVSRLKLRLIPLHPDKTGGLAFLNLSTYAFTPILIGQGAALAGLFAGQILHTGQDLMHFKVQIVCFLGFFIVVLLIPLTVFIPSLGRAKRQGLGEFGSLASRYVREFEEKWVRGGVSPSEALLGSADVQSLADLGNSFSFVQEMRVMPFGPKDVASLASVAAVPFLPLLLTIFSPEQLADYLIKMLF
jgi:hypothetical protein